MNRNAALGVLGAAATWAATGPAAAAVQPLPLQLRTMRVPFDHDRPEDGGFPLQFALLRPFDVQKPTVAVVSDGQQFFVTAEAFRRTIEKIFDERFNVDGVFGRGQSADVQGRIGSADGSVDWVLAYRFLCARQWIGDIEAMRQALLGSDGKLLLYGRSGGAMMVHQYLSRHGGNAERAFTQAAVDNYLEAEYGLESDRFWEEISPGDQKDLTSVLRRLPNDRNTIIAVLQRQNFFVDRAQLAAQRHALIRSLAAGDNDLVSRLVIDFQVGAIRKLEASPLGPAIAVRRFELETPLAARYDFAKGGPGFFRSRERIRAGRPAVLSRARRPSRVSDVGPPALHRVPTAVLMIAGRWDHTCDYRSQIALASCYPSSTLVILDDDHTFHRMAQSTRTRDVTIGALSPTSSAAYRDAMSILDALRWRDAG